jgi:hypothetical protein
MNTVLDIADAVQIFRAAFVEDVLTLCAIHDHRVLLVEHLAFASGKEMNIVKVSNKVLPYTILPFLQKLLLRWHVQVSRFPVVVVQ